MNHWSIIQNWGFPWNVKLINLNHSNLINRRIIKQNILGNLWLKISQSHNEFKIRIKHKIIASDKFKTIWLKKHSINGNWNCIDTTKKTINIEKGMKDWRLFTRRAALRKLKWQLKKKMIKFNGNVERGGFKSEWKKKGFVWKGSWKWMRWRGNWKTKKWGGIEVSHCGRGGR